VVISASAVLILAIVLVVMIRSKTVKIGPALVAALFGFFLASTNMAPSVNRFLTSLADTISNIKL
jgi:hypothetical protein